MLATHRFELCTAFVISALGFGLGLGIPADQSLGHPYDKLISVSTETLSACYSIFNAAFYWDDSVQQEYRWACSIFLLMSVTAFAVI